MIADELDARSTENGRDPVPWFPPEVVDQRALRETFPRDLDPRSGVLSPVRDM
ncbi:hypothetical protein Acsp05_38930 [Actinokineospora sp. NBRC 105648]|nr:hypothetical protein Acsp05_38930 [Actinokineospora sp. NBRC 105648]